MSSIILESGPITREVKQAFAAQPTSAVKIIIEPSGQMFSALREAATQAFPGTVRDASVYIFATVNSLAELEEFVRQNDKSIHKIWLDKVIRASFD